MSYINRTTGKSIDLNAHIAQSILDILTTAIGSRVMRRDYGSLLPRLVDRPANDEHMMQMMSATVMAIASWEPRITTTFVNFTPIDMTGMMDIEIEALIKDTNELLRLQYELFGDPDAMMMTINGGQNNGLSL